MRQHPDVRKQPEPGLAAVGRVRRSGTWSAIAIAPALHPASAAPPSHAATIACHRAVSRSVFASSVGLPPER